MNIQLKRKILQTYNEYIVKEEDTADIYIMNAYRQLNRKIIGRYCRQIMNIQLKRKILQTNNEYIVKQEDTADNEYIIKEEDIADR